MVKIAEFLHRNTEYSHETFVDVGAGKRTIVDEAVRFEEE